MLKKFPKRNIFISEKEIKAVLSFLFRPRVRAEDFVRKFEDNFSRHIGVKEAIAVGSGRFALSLILRSLGVQRGDAVLLSAYNFTGVPESLRQEGVEPHFVDADPSTYQMNIDLIPQKITEKTKVLLATHLFGQLSDTDRLADLARENHLYLIEDAAQALGSFYKNRPAGTRADIGLFSFTGSKLLNTSWGGMIVTNNADLAGKIRQELSRYPALGTAQAVFFRVKTYAYALATQRAFYSYLVYPLTVLFYLCGIDLFAAYKMFDRRVSPYKRNGLNNLQGYLGLDQMDRLEQFIKKRKEYAGKLLAQLAPAISLQKGPPDADPCYFMIPLKAKHKGEAYKKLLLKGIDSNIQYAADCSGLTGVHNPCAADLSQHILTMNLPLRMSDQDINYMAQSINDLKDMLE